MSDEVSILLIPSGKTSASVKEVGVLEAFSSQVPRTDYLCRFPVEVSVRDVINENGATFKAYVIGVKQVGQAFVMPCDKRPLNSGMACMFVHEQGGLMVFAVVCELQAETGNVGSLLKAFGGWLKDTKR